MDVNGVTVVIFGFGTVFVGLILLIVAIGIMSGIIKNAVKAPAAAPAVNAAPAPAADQIENRGPFVAAAAAAIATVMGTDVSGLRIVSIKKVK